MSVESAPPQEPTATNPNEVGWSHVVYAEEPAPIAYTEETLRDIPEPVEYAPEQTEQEQVIAEAKDVLQNTPELFTAIDSAINMAGVDLKKINDHVKPLDEKISKKEKRLEKAEEKYHKIRAERRGGKTTRRERYYKSRVMNLTSDKIGLEKKRDHRLSKINSDNALWSEEQNTLRKTPGYRALRENLGKIDENLEKRQAIIDEYTKLSENPENQSTEHFALLRSEISSWNNETPEEYRDRLSQEAKDEYETWVENDERQQKIAMFKAAENEQQLREKIKADIHRETDESKRHELISATKQWQPFNKLVDGDVDGYLDWQNEKKEMKQQAREERAEGLLKAAAEMIELRKKLREEIMNESQKIADDDERSEMIKEKTKEMYEKVKEVRIAKLAGLNNNYNAKIKEIDG